MGMQNSGLSGLSVFEKSAEVVVAGQAEAVLEWPDAARIPIVPLPDF